MSKENAKLLSDPATELVRLIGILRNCSQQPGSIFESFARAIGIDTNDSYYSFIVSKILFRVDDTIELIERISPDIIPDEALIIAVNNLKLMKNIFSYKVMSSPAGQIGNYITPELETSLKFVAAQLRKVKPIIIIEQAEADKIIAEIGNIRENLDNIEAINRLPDWIRLPLMVGLEDLSRSLKYSNIIGQECIFESFIKLKNRADYVVLNIENEKNAGHKSLIENITRIAVIGIMITDLFTAPANLFESGKKYYELMRHGSETNLNVEQRLLLPPKQGAIEYRNT